MVLFSTRHAAGAVAAAAALAASSSPADARVIVVADGTRSATLTDVVRNSTVLRIPVGDPIRAAATAADGTRLRRRRGADRRAGDISR